MALKEEPYALPLKLGGQPFSKATACGANSCILASYAETPSIAWISTSPLVVDGVICALPKFTGWSQKSHLRAEWPFAVSIWKRPGAAKSFAFFVYHLAEAAYYVFKISSDAQTALMMGYERAAIVLKDSLLIYNLFDPTRPPISIPTGSIPQLLPALCYASSSELILTSYNTIILLSVNPKTAEARISFQSHAEGFGFVEVAPYDNTIAAISEGGHKLHLYDTYQSDPADRNEEHEIIINSPIPITKLFIDEDFVITGMADGTMKLYDRELRTFLSQLNVIPTAARGAVLSDGHSTAGPAYLQHKISFLARHDELVIASMLDPSSSSGTAQLELSIWPIRGQNVVQPLKTKLLPGAVNFVHYEERNSLLMALTQHDLEPDSPKYATSSNSIANRGPLVLLSWHPPFKSLMASGIKWRETNTQQQTKLAGEVMEKILLEPTFFRAMFNVEADPEEIEQIVESMFICLSGKEALQGTFIDTAITQEIFIRKTAPLSAVPSSSNALSHSGNLTDSSKESSGSKAPMTPTTSSKANERSNSVSTSNVPPPPQYFPPHAMTTAVITKCLSELSSSYISTVLNKPLLLLIKGPISELMFALPSTHATTEEQPMISSLIRVTQMIIDGLIDHQSKFSQPLQRMLCSIHHTVCTDNHPDSELKSFRRGAARVFLDYVLLKPWLEPVDAGLVNKLSDEARHNLRVVAQLMQVIGGYSKHKLSDPGLCSLVTEYSTKWRSWLLSKVSESHGERDGTPSKLRDKRKNMSRGASFVAQKSGNSKTAALVVTKFIITHVQELLTVMTRFEGRTPDPCATRIRAISDSLMMPIMTIMAKKGTKNVHLAASLRVFGRTSGASGSTNSSGSSHTNSSSESISSESIGGMRDENSVSEGKQNATRLESTSPSKRRKPKRKSSAASAPPSIDSLSSEARMSVEMGSSELVGPTSLSASQSSSVKKSPRPKKRRSKPFNKKVSSGSLTASSNDDDKDEDDSDSSECAHPPRSRSSEVLPLSNEIMEVTVASVPPIPTTTAKQLSSSTPGVTPTTTARKRRKAKLTSPPVPANVTSH